MPMTPGTYLQKRREAAGLTQREAAAALAGICWYGHLDRIRLDEALARLCLVESDEAHLDREEAFTVTRIFPFDHVIYRQLVELASTAFNSHLPVPVVCRACACSFFFSCRTPHDPCTWAEPDLCTACLDAEALRAAVAADEIAELSIGDIANG